MARADRGPTAPKRVLSIHAHPDDQEFTVAGTLARWARQGSEIITVCLTRGDAGSNRFTPPEMTRPELARIREQEQRAACRVPRLERFAGRVVEPRELADQPG